MKLLELFRVINEATQRIYTRVSGPLTAIYSSSKAVIPTLIFIANDADNLHNANSVTAVKLQPTSIKKMYNDIARKNHQGNITETDMLVAQVIQRIQKLNINREALVHIAEFLPVKIQDLPSRAAVYKYVTTDLGKAVGIYDHLFGERPVMGEEDYMPFHNAKVYLPDGMSKRALDAALSVLEEVYQNLEESDESAVFGGDIHFANLPSRIGGLYDENNRDIKVNLRVKKSDTTVFSLLHEYGHKRMNEMMTSEQIDAVKKKYSEIRRAGEVHLGDMDFSSQLYDVLDSIDHGDEIRYSGKSRKYNRLNGAVVTKKGDYKKTPAVWIGSPSHPDTTIAIFPITFLAKRGWTVGGQKIVVPEHAKHTKETDQWFPTRYSENANIPPQHQYTEWWAELYGLYTYGTLKGAPAKWMAEMLTDGIGETVGSNDGEINSDSDMPPVAHGDEEGNASWDWTDPNHSSGEENAVMSRTP